jgi:hypothetical protein
VRFVNTQLVTALQPQESHRVATAEKELTESKRPGFLQTLIKLQFISRIVERVVDVRMTDYVNQFQLMPTFQSAYPPLLFHRDSW